MKKLIFLIVMLFALASCTTQSYPSKLSGEYYDNDRFTGYSFLLTVDDSNASFDIQYPNGEHYKLSGTWTYDSAKGVGKLKTHFYGGYDVVVRALSEKGDYLSYALDLTRNVSLQGNLTKRKLNDEKSL